MARYPSRKQKPGEHTYLFTRIPLSIWTPAVQKSAQDHALVCGENSPERCPVHNMRAVLLRLLEHYTKGTLSSAAERI